VKEICRGAECDLKSIKMKPEIKLVQLSSNMPDKNVFRSHSMYIGRIDHRHIYRVLIKVPLSDIPENAVIIKATLKLSAISRGYGDVYKAYLVTQKWSKCAVTWNTQPSFHPEVFAVANECNSQPVLDSAVPIQNIFMRRAIKYKFDITDIVRGWMTGSYQNRGLLLKNNESKNCRFIKIIADQRNYCAPVVEIKYAVQCGCTCEVIPTQFVESVETVDVTNQFSYSEVKDVSLAKTVTVFIHNSVTGTIAATLQISPDGIHFADDNGIQVLPGTNAAVVPYIFAKYMRVALTTVEPGSESTATIWYQVQK